MPKDPISVRTTISAAFEGDSPPAELAVGIVSLVELAKITSLDPAKVRSALEAAGFETGAEAAAEESGATLSLEKDVVAGAEFRKLKHELFGRDRYGDPVIFLLSTGDTRAGKITFLSAVFRGAIEADAVKAATHVTKSAPITGALSRNRAGKVLRRVFWHIRDMPGIQGLLLSGPDNVEAIDLIRALTFFGKGA